MKENKIKRNRAWRRSHSVRVEIKTYKKLKTGYYFLTNNLKSIDKHLRERAKKEKNNRRACSCYICANNFNEKKSGKFIDTDFLEIKEYKYKYNKR